MFGDQLTIDDENNQEVLFEDSESKMRTFTALECASSIFDRRVIESYGWSGNDYIGPAYYFSEMVDFIRQLVNYSVDDIGDFVSLHRKHFDNLGRYLVICKCLSRKYKYCEPINLFIEASDRLRKCCSDRGGNVDCCLASYGIGLARSSAIEFFGLFARQVVDLYAEKYRQRFSRERSLLRNRQRDFETNIDKLFLIYRRLIVLRLDLYYRPDEIPKVDSTRACEDFERMLNNRRHNRIFEGMVGYIAKLEYGIQRGFHWHVIFFLDGDVRMPTADVYHAKTIGDYWSEFITVGAGSYYNVNASIKRIKELDRLGVGCISRGDEKFIYNLKKYVLAYLLKAEQEIREIDGPKLRMVRCGFGG